MMRKLVITSALLLPLILLASPRAEAGPRDFLICIPGSPGSSASAASYMKPFFRRIESLAGWPVGATQGSYHPKYSGCMSQIRTGKPGFAVMALGVYLKHRRSLKLKAIGQVDMFAGAGKRLYLVVRKGTYSSLSELKGKKLTSNHLAEKRFLNQILFRGKIKVSQHFQLRMVYRTTKGMRNVARGRADATIINDDELKTMKRRSWGKSLKILLKSPPLPGAVLVAFGQHAKPADVTKLKSVIGRMCKGAQGNKLCKSSGIRGMRPASQATFARMIRMYR